MKKLPTQVTYVVLFVFVAIFQISCSKDSDLLADYVAIDSQSTFVEVKVVALINESMIIQVFESLDDEVNTGAMEVTQPANGTAEVNEDNTITYTPNSDATGTDEFNYSTAEQNGNITVTTVSSKMDVWKLRFEQEWPRTRSFYTKESTGPEPAKTQRRYFDHNLTDGLIAMIQATGDLNYVDDLVWYVDRVMNLAKKSSDGYYDWPINGVHYQLYDAHGWRNIFKFLLLAEKYPAIKTRMTSAKFNDWKAWWTTNLWDKWISRGNNYLMRGQTHMASHMSSNMAIYLYLLETDQTKKNEYLSWVNAWNDDIASKYNANGFGHKGFRDMLRTGSHGGYVWSKEWGDMGNYNDLGHTNAETQAVINQYLQGIGDWTTADIAKFIVTINAMMDASPSSDYTEMPYRLNAVYKSSDNNYLYKDYGWVMFGRFDANFQKRLEDCTIQTAKGGFAYSCFIGNMAYNQAYLEDTLVFPEF